VSDLVTHDAPPVVVAQQTCVFPPGSDPDDPRARRFCVTVSRVAKDTWHVHQTGSMAYWSVDGRWHDNVTAAHRTRFAFATHEKALAAALVASAKVLVDGLTWKQWERVSDKARKDRESRWALPPARANAPWCRGSGGASTR
jgi:hypothetical protein